MSKIYSPKQLEILHRALNEDWFMMINHGAVRAGKTVLNNDLFLMELMQVKQRAERDKVQTPMYILAAVSSSTLYTNVLQELTNKYGIKFNFDKHGNFTLFGVKVVTTFTRTVTGIGSIRGMTAYGAYINEASLANKFVFDEIIKRCSGTGARIILDTNPEYPTHWLKADYIDKADGKRVVSNQFSIFDNPFLSETYIENVMAVTPSGPMTQRGIYGLWVAGEGAIYADFDKNRHVVDTSQFIDSMVSFIVGVDWGYEHTGVMVVLGQDDNGAWYLIEEHAHKHKHIDGWVRIAKRIQERYGTWIPFYCDSARPEYVDALYYAGLKSHNASKAVSPGISEVAKLIKNNLFFVDTCAAQFLSEIDRYVWSDKGDMPVKENDDAMDAVRYAIYTDSVMP